jgi:thymidylate synthase
MFTSEYEGINSFLVEASQLLLEKGVKRQTRDKICWELPEPFMFKIKNPTSRWVTIPERKWNPVLPYAESLWLASGRNDLELIGHYLKRMVDFSDDGFFLRGGYGPRLRNFNGDRSDYKIDHLLLEHEDKSRTDQFKYIVESFNRDINTRQAIINIGDPLKDCFDENEAIKRTKDLPCTRLLHFMRDPIEYKLNLTVYMRSNDILWGASAVNVFNFTFIQEYFANILNLGIGHYYHVANNFHFYEEYKKEIELIADAKDVKDECFIYSSNINSLEDFNSKLVGLHEEESRLRREGKIEFVDFEDDFFNDWYKVLYSFNTKSRVVFKNPILNQIYEPKFLKYEQRKY